MDAINSAIAEKVLPNIQTAIRIPAIDSNANLDLRTDGPQRNPNAGTNRNTRVDSPKTGLEQSNLNNHHPESSVDSKDSDDGYGS